jgi:hypothetical protein
MRPLIRPGGGIVQLSAAPAAIVDSSAVMSIDFPLFGVVFTHSQMALDIEFPLFALTNFKIRSDGFHIPFAAFDTSLQMVSGSLHLLSAVFPAFSADFSSRAGETLQIVFPSFSTAFSLSPGNQSASLQVSFPLFTWTASLQALLASTGVAVWVVNTRTKAHSTYENWSASGYGRFNGEELVAMPDGIYGLRIGQDGSTSVDAKLRWQETDLNTAGQKRIDSLSINMRNLAQSDIRVIAVVDEQQERFFNKPVSNIPQGLRRFRQLLPQGLEGQTWQFGIENQAGGDLLVDGVEVLVHDLKRRFQ